VCATGAVRLVPRWLPISQRGRPYRRAGYGFSTFLPNRAKASRVGVVEVGGTAFMMRLGRPCPGRIAFQGPSLVTISGRCGRRLTSGLDNSGNCRLRAECRFTRLDKAKSRCGVVVKILPGTPTGRLTEASRRGFGQSKPRVFGFPLFNTPAGESRQLPRPKKISLCEAPHAAFAIDVAMQLRSSSRSKGDTRCASSSF
jgi:hypothetical protein